MFSRTRTMDDDIDAKTSGDERSIEAILQRRQARRSERKHTHAPDVLHGDCRVDEIYETFGECWVEQTLFVERVTNRDGETFAWTVATLDGGFLEIEHAVAGEVDDIGSWLEGRVSEKNRVVALELVADEQTGPLRGCTKVMGVESSRLRLGELEGDHLQVTRDRDFGRGATFSHDPEERLLESRLDVMSLVCLVGRLL